MPLIRPEIQKVLRSAGLMEEPAGEKTAGEDGTLTDKLNDAGLSLREILENLAYTAKESNNEGLRVRCLETALKVHGAMKDSAPAIPSFTIVIQESSSAPTSDPTIKGVNPILLPRQLLSSLPSSLSSSSNLSTFNPIASNLEN